MTLDPNAYASQQPPASFSVNTPPPNEFGGSLGTSWMGSRGAPMEQLTQLGSMMRGEVAQAQIPAWQRLPAFEPGYTQMQQEAANASGQQQPIVQPGAPVRFDWSPFSTDNSFVQSPAGVALGASPGGQRGGFLTGPGGIPIATVPITAANFASYGREGLIALLTSAAGMDYQQGPNGEAPARQGGLVGAGVGAVNDFGNLINAPLDAFNSWWRNSDNFNRGKSVRQLFQSGHANSGWFDVISSAVTGGSDKFSAAGLRNIAAREGMDYISSVSKYWDLAPEIVAAIANDPTITDDELGKLTDGQPISLNPVVNIGMELAHTGIGIGIAAKVAPEILAAALPAEIAGFVGAGSAAARVATIGARLYAANSAIGWSIRGAEWGIKEIAGLTGNTGVAAAADKLLWQMPFSMNPGLNLMDALTTHPIAAARNLVHGNVQIGESGALSDVGVLRLSDLSLRTPEGRLKYAGERTVPGLPGEVAPEGTHGITYDAQGNAIFHVGGVPLKLSLKGDEGVRARDFLDQYADPARTDAGALQTAIFNKLGWDPAAVDAAFGPGNAKGLTLNDLKNGLLHVAMVVARDRSGMLGRLDGIAEASMVDRNLHFVRGHALDALNILRDNLSGADTSITSAFREQFWQLAAYNDTHLGEIKQYLSGKFDPVQSLADFQGWISASKTVNRAYAEGLVREGSVPVFRSDVSLEYLRAFRERIAKTLQPDEIVPRSMLNALKRYGGAVEQFGQGPRLLAKVGRRTFKDLTRTQVEEILASIEEEAGVARAREAGGGVARETSKLYSPDGVSGPGVDPLADARVAGITPTAVTLIEAMRVLPDESRTAPLPEGLLEKVAEQTGTTPAELARSMPEAWKAVIDWYDNRLAQVEQDSADFRAARDFGYLVNERAAKGDLPAGVERQAREGLDRIMFELANPPDLKLAKSVGADVLRRYEEAKLEADAYLQEVQSHLDDPAQKAAIVSPTPDTMYAVPRGVSGEVMGALLEVEARAASLPGTAPSDAAILTDASRHPLLRLDALQRSIPGDEFTAATSSFPPDAIRGMIGDVLGPDAEVGQVGADAVLSRALGYRNQGADLAALAADAGRRFETVWGRLTERTQGIIDRGTDWERTNPKGPSFTQISLDPLAEFRSQQLRSVNVRAQLQRQIASAEAKATALEAKLAKIPEGQQDLAAAPVAESVTPAAPLPVESAAPAPAPVEHATVTPDHPETIAAPTPEPAVPEPPPLVHLGAETSFQDPRTERTNPILAQFAVVEAMGLRNSWDPGYDQSLQPREIDPLRQSSVDKMARGLDAVRMLNHDTGAEGVPLLGPTGDVVAGNHRTQALRLADDAVYSVYRDALNARAAEFGIDPAQIEGMNRPVLVRVLRAEHATPEMARALNDATGGMGITELGAALANELTPEDLGKLAIGEKVTLADALGNVANADLVRRVMGRLTERQQGEYMDSSGKLNMQGRKLLESTILAKVIGGGPVLESLVESADSELGYIGKGITEAAGQVAQAESLIALGQRFDVRAGPVLAPAIELLMEARARKLMPGETVDYIRGNRIEGAADPVVSELALALRGMRSGAEVARFLRGYAEAIREGPDASMPGLFGPAEPPSVLGLLNRGVDAVNENRTAKTADSMFGEELLPHLSNADGTATYGFQTGSGSQATAATLPVVGTPQTTVAANVDPSAVLRVHGPWQAVAGARATHAGPLEWRAPSPALERAYRHMQITEPAELVAQVGVRWDALRLYQDTHAARRFYDLTVQRLNDPANEATYADWLVASHMARQVRWDPAGNFIGVYGGDAFKIPTARTVKGWVDADKALGADVTILPADAAAATEGQVLLSGPTRPVPPPDFAATHDFTPDMTPAAGDVGAALDAGAHVIVPPGDAVTSTLAGRHVGAPHDPQRIITANTPGISDRVRRMAEQHDAAVQQLAELRAKLAKEPVPQGLPPDFAFDQATGELWQRYMIEPGYYRDPLQQATDAAARANGVTIPEGAPMPRSMSEVMDALVSIDYGVPPRAPMAPAEIEQLRSALEGLAHQRLNDVGAPGGDVVRQARKATAKGRLPEPPTTTDPARYSSELRDVARMLQGHIHNVDDPLVGWEGTQYEVGRPPLSDLQGNALPPRLIYRDYMVDIGRLNDVVPGLGDEMLMGRRRAWPERVKDTRIAQSIIGNPLIEKTIGARRQSDINRQAISNFVDELLGPAPLDAKGLKDWQAQAKDVAGLYDEWQNELTLHKVPITGMLQYRRAGIAPSDLLERTARRYFDGVWANQKPEWYRNLVGNDGKAPGQPIAEAWYKADNRIRQTFLAHPGPISTMVESIYGHRGMAGKGRGITIAYHLMRYALSLHFLAQEFLDTPQMLAAREGVGSLLDLVPGREANPMRLGQENVGGKILRNWSTFVSQAEPGGWQGLRSRGVMSAIARGQDRDLGAIIQRFAVDHPDVRASMQQAGDTPVEYLHRLNNDLEIAAARGKQVESRRMAELLAPFKDVMAPGEYGEMVKAGYYTGHPAIEAELAKVSDPVHQALLKRLWVANEQGWHDVFQTFYGQMDRSNLQRALNHPLLWFPISYQIKATKWLARVMLDRMGGYDTGTLGLLAYGRFMEQQRQMVANDPEYRAFLQANKNLFFFAQMMLPISPDSMSVSLSPFTRAAIALLSGDSSYSRNIFSFGAGYDLFNLGPRLFFEQGKPGSIIGDSALSGIPQTLGHTFPYTIPVTPSSSRQTQATQQTIGQQPIPTAPPPEQPPSRFP